MRAAVLHHYNEPLKIEEVAIAEPGPGEVLVRLAASGVCRSDLHALEGEAGVEAAPPERSMLENHRTGAGYFAGDSEALYESKDHEKHWSEHADLLICRQKPDGHR